MFGDSYKAPPEETGKGPANESSARKKGRTVAITTKDMQKRRNDVKARTTLLLTLPDEHQLRFSKYETAKELWEAILKTFDTLEQTFNILQAIVSHLEFMDVEIEQDDLNQKFLTSLAPEWLISPKEVRIKLSKHGFISSSNTSSGKGEVHTASVPTGSIQVSTANTDVAAASLSHDTIFSDSYKAPPEETGKGSASESSAKKKGRTVVITTKDMQKRRNDVKARTTLLLALPNEHRLTFSKYETAKELWEAILKTFGGNEATKKTKKNQLKQQYGNFKDEGSETLEKTFNRLQAIVSHLEFMDVEIKQDDLNQKFLTSIAPEWLMYTIVWRNIDDLDTMSLDDVYNHLKVYEPEVQKKSESNSQNIAFISSSNTNSGKSEVSTASVPTASIQVSTTSTDVAATSLSHDTICLERRLSYMANEEENHALVADDEVPTEFALMAKSNSSSDNEIYSPPKKDLSWTGLPEFVDDTVTDYSRHTPSIDDSKCNKSELQSSNFSVFEHGESSDSIIVIKTSNTENARKSTVKYAEMYRNISKGPKEDKGKTWPKDNYAHKSMTPRVVLLKPDITPIVLSRPNMNVAQPKMTSFTKTAHSNVKSPFQGKSSVKNQPRVPRVATVSEIIPTVDSKFSTAKSTFTADLGNKGKSVKASACWIWRPKHNTTEQGPNCNDVSVTFKKYQYIDTQGRIKSNSGCSRHMTGNISYLSEYEPYDGGYVSFGYEGGKITGKGIIKTGKLEFENLYFVKELKTPRQHNMYSINLNNIVPYKNLTCLVAKASVDENMLWHKRLGHLNFKTMNKLVRNNLVKGLPSKCFKNDHTCVACLKGKQHKASCKTKLVNSVSKPLHTLYMDLFGPTSVSSLNHKLYCLVVTDDFCGFTWTFFLRTKDETSSILRNFITEIENLKDLKLRIIKCDNGGEFKNKEMNEFCTKKGIRREFGNDRTPQQNRVLVNKSQNKTPYELFNSRIPAIGFLRSFGCHVMILNTSDHLRKFDAKRDEGYFVGYSLSSKVFRVFNKRTKKVEENLHVDFLENKLIEKRASPNWLFDIDTLTNSMNYVPVVVTGTSSTNISGTKDVACQAVKKDVSSLRYIALPNWFHEAHMETYNDTIRNSDAQDDSQKEQDCNADVTESSGISNPTATSKVSPVDQYQMDVKSAFLYGTIDEEVYVMQPPGCQDLEFLKRVYKLYREFKALMHDKFQMSVMGELTFFLGLQVLQKRDGIFLSQDKYVGDVLKKFGYSDVRSANTPMDKENPWGKDRPECHLHAVKRIFRYLKGHPKLSDYGGATQDRKSTTKGCQFMGKRLISWQCKKQTIVATSTTKAEYVAAASGCGQVL
nr:hypothetical protein [Tanacetum cinerariifolium]